MNMIPEQMLSDILLHVERPGRYVGGEYGNTKAPDEDTVCTIALCFPDLYEIGMSNNAVRILFDLFNKIDGVVCDIVFTPAPDFSQVLEQRDIPLYTLTYGIPVAECDILAFTIGYELAATNILKTLDLSKIPRRCADRSEGAPVVIAGGPSITNPIPFGAWIDGIYMGDSEAAGGIRDALEKIVETRRSSGRSRSREKEILQSLSCMWHAGSEDTVSTIIYDQFGTTEESPYDERIEYYLSPNVSIVQDHGVVEIMRGCPNGCRFCHAGEYYRPYRQKPIERIIEEIEERITTYGNREITLSSLSTGDYPYLQELIEELNKRYNREHVSFSLPSLKVNSFTLPVLQTVSHVRKSGLTFAIETPNEEWQASMNKHVPRENVISIIREAKALGWKLAKFYFMTGLPYTDRETEAEEIASYLSAVYQATKIQMNINIGTFVPKPHTPFQWAEQLRPDAALEHLKQMKSKILASVPKAKVNFHDPYVSYIEGILSRGDERVIEIVERAYDRGAFLDAWDEYIKRDIWKEVIAEADWQVEDEICGGHAAGDELPWDSVISGAGKGFLKNENLLAERREYTDICSEDCDHLCGVCTPKGSKVNDASKVNSTFKSLDASKPEAQEDTVYRHVIGMYEKKGKAIYYSHINMMNLTEKMFLRKRIPIEFTHGFNPKPRLEFASPLPMGVSGERELMMLRVPEGYDISGLIDSCNAGLPKDIRFTGFFYKGKGHKSLSAAYGGSVYQIDTTSLSNGESLHALFDEVCESHPNVKILEKAPERLLVSISEGKSLTGNLLKCIDPILPKYDFLSRFTIVRMNLLDREGQLMSDFIRDDLSR